MIFYTQSLRFCKIWTWGDRRWREGDLRQKKEQINIEKKKISGDKGRTVSSQNLKKEEKSSVLY